jgi:carbamoyltransferase
VLHEQAAQWFELDRAQESPYMLLVAPLRSEHHLPLRADQLRTMREHPDLRQRLQVPRSTVPAITHVDFSARVQTVDAERNPRFYELLQAFYRRTGCPLLVNTSFNIRGEPIVCTPEQAWRCFQATDMDALVMEDCLVEKDGLGQSMDVGAREEYRAQFQPD